MDRDFVPSYELNAESVTTAQNIVMTPWLHDWLSLAMYRTSQDETATPPQGPLYPSRCVSGPTDNVCRAI